VAQQSAAQLPAVSGPSQTPPPQHIVGRAALQAGGVIPPVEGSFRGPDGMAHALSIQSRLAHGSSRDLAELVRRADGRGLEITLGRDRRSLFDGLALSELAPRDVARGVLRNLVDDSRVTARAAP
jgi:hypothetical protein